MKQRIQEALRRRHRKGDEGFTLIELLVVILIIAILAAVGIIALLSALNSGRKSAATTVLRNSITSVRSWQTGEGQTHFDGVSETEMATSDPDIDWVAGGTAATAGENSVSVNTVTTTGGIVYLASQSDTEVCYYASLDPSPAAGDPATQYASAAAGGTCSAGGAAALAGTAWFDNTGDGWDN